MNLDDKSVSKKSKKFCISTVLYIVAWVVGLVGVAFLVDNIYLYLETVKQYVAQGYPIATIISNLIPSQLLPGIFQPVAVYGGIAFILVGVGKVNKKVSKCLAVLTKDENCNDVIEESILEQNVEDTETTEQDETVE